VDEAVSLLGSVLKAKGYAAIRTDRTLKIVTLDQAKKAAAKQSDPKKPAAKPGTPTTPTTPASGSGQRAFIDPATGKLREPEPGEAEALHLQPGARRALQAAPAPQQIAGPGGAIGMAVPEEAMSYSVATLNPDGSVSMACVTGNAKAEAIVKSPATAKKTTKKEEHNHDR
jgi:hypothetical protein